MGKTMKITMTKLEGIFVMAAVTWKKRDTIPASAAERLQRDASWDSIVVIEGRIVGFDSCCCSRCCLPTIDTSTGDATSTEEATTGELKMDMLEGPVLSILLVRLKDQVASYHPTIFDR
jgi:hypothetical protein